MIELKTCPFCGSKIKIVCCDDEGNRRDQAYENDPWSGLGYRLYHPDSTGQECPIAGEAEIGGWIYDTKEEAAEAWNRRVEK